MRPRVLLLIKGLGRGGAEQILASSAPHLDHDRFDYHAAYVLPWKDAHVKDLADAGVTTHCLNGGRGPASVRSLHDLIRERRIDLVHAHSPVPASAARAMPFGRRPRMVYTEHNVWERYHPLTRWANAHTFGRDDHVFAVSRHVGDSIRVPGAVARRGMPPVEVLYHGIDQAQTERWLASDGVRDELGIPADAPVVGTVANFKAHKRLDLLIGAAFLVRSENGRLLTEADVVAGGSVARPLVWDLQRDAPVAVDALTDGSEQPALFGEYLVETPRGAVACYPAFQGYAGECRRYRPERAAVEQQAVALYKQIYPEATRIFNPRRQMESTLLNSGATVAGNDEFSEALQDITDVIAASQNAEVYVQSLLFNADQADVISLSMTLSQQDALDEMRERLAETDLRLDVGKTTPAGNAVAVDLRLLRGQ